MITIPYEIHVFLIVISSYCWGSIPTSYLTAKILHGVDIRKSGSGNVGASNTMALVGIPLGLTVGTVDCLAKGTLPIILAKMTGQDISVQVLVGIALICGHNWSVFIRFTGGRGIATSIGILIGLYLWIELIIMGVLFGLIGRLIVKDTSLWTFASMITLPLLAYLVMEPLAIRCGVSSIVVISILKRATANWEPVPRGHKWYQILINRIILDRDISNRDSWTTRTNG